MFPIPNVWVDIAADQQRIKKRVYQAILRRIAKQTFS
jgi:hypothetical protein